MKRTHTKMRRVFALFLALMTFASLCVPTTFATEETAGSSEEILTQGTGDNTQSSPTDVDTPSVVAARGAEGWLKEAVYDITLTGETGIASVSTQSGDEEALELIPDEEGKYLFTVGANGDYTIRVTDTAGTEYTHVVTETNIDNEVPVLSEISQTNQEDSDKVLYSFTAADAGSGLAAVTVTVNDSEPVALELTDDGIYSVEAEADSRILVEAADALGNTGTVKNFEDSEGSDISGTDNGKPVEDTDKPVVEVIRSADSWTNEAAYEIRATDASGIASVTVQRGEEDPASLTATDEGTYLFAISENATFTVVVTDTAGNVCEVVVTEDHVDTEVPVLSEISRVTEGFAEEAEYTFTVFDTLSGVSGVSVTVGEQDPVALEAAEDGSYHFTVTSNADILVKAADGAGNVSTQSLVEEEIVPPANNSTLKGSIATYATSLQSETLSSTYANSHLINSLEYLGNGVQYLKDNGLFFEMFMSTNGSSTLYSSILNNGWRWTKYDDTTAVAPSSGMISGIWYMNQAYDTANGHAMGTETTSSGLPDVSYFVQRGWPCLSYPNYYYFNYLPNVVKKETFADGSYIDYKAATDYLRNFFNTYTYSTTGLVMEHCPGTLELWIEALDEAVSKNSSNPYFTVTKYSDYNQATQLDESAMMDKLSPGDLIFFSGNVTGTDAGYSHVSLYAGRRNIVKYAHLDGTGYLEKEHFFVDMSLSGTNLVNASHYGSGSNKAADAHTWYHIEFKPQRDTTPEEQGAIQVYKKDPSGKNLSGAKFSIIDSSGNFVATLGPTDANGYATTGKTLPYGTYTVKETVFPDGYTSNGTTEWTVTVSSSTATVTINAVNKEIPTTEGDGKIEVYKKDPSGNNLSGAEFKVTNTSTGTSYTMGPTDSSGYASVSGLPYGTYTIQETKFPDGYTVSGTNSWTATVSSGTKTFTINAVNEEVPTIPQLIIVKTTNTGRDLSGWQFKVTYKKYGFITTTVGTYTTGSDGTVTITDLEAGTAYTVTEVASSSSYWKCDSSSQSVTLEDGKTTTISFYNEYCGKIKVTKTTNTGSNKNGWVFDVKDLNGNTVATLTTGSDGTATSDNIPAGTYTVTERGTDNTYWSCDVAPKVVTVVGGSTTNVTVNNNHYGRIKVQKTTNTGNNLSGWVFVVKNSSGTTVATLTTGSDGTATTGNLVPGTYSVTEKSNNNQYWECDVSAKTVTVAGGSTTTVTVNNNHLGKLKIIKYTNTGSNRSGWVFDVKNSSGTIVATLTTGSDGTVTSGNLAPGEYTVVERSNGDSYWTCDVSAKKVTIVAGTTVNTSVTNTHYGKIKVTKTTNTGNNRSGWSFDIKDASGTLMETITTGSDGTATSGKLLPGKYTVTEHGSTDPYWSCDLTAKNATVTAGYTTNITVNNIHRGRAQVIKKTNTGNNLVNWQFGIYTDANCTNHVGTVKSGSDGKSDVLYLEPGTYYWKEIGNTDGLFNSEYWPSNATVQALVISPGQQTTVEHTNIHYGKIKMIKKMATDGPLEGWVFHIYDASGTEVTGSPFTTAADGTIVTGVLLPGTYTVKEDLPSNNLYYCKSDNPQTVTVTAGQTASVEFTNALRPGKIEITKVNFSGQKLADAKFMLEWSEDGVNWKPVQFSTKEDVVKGGCTSPNLTADGTLITDASGVITFETLYPTLKYRVTEVEAPEGYVLLKEAAYTGELPIEDLTVDLTVYNGRNYVLPATGVDDGLYGLVTIGTSLLLLAVIVSFMLITRTVPNGKYAEVYNHHKKGKNKNA